MLSPGNILYQKEQSYKFLENYNFPLTSSFTFFFIFLFYMFNMGILAKYAVILWAVGMNCTRDGVVVERSWSE